MIKKIAFYILCGMILLFSISCYENDQEATITVDFGSVEALEQATGISGISKASSIIPYTVTTIEIKVYSGDEVKGVVYRRIFYRREFAGDRVTISVPAGKGRIVKAIARQKDGSIIYTGTSVAPIDLVSGVDVTVPVNMLAEDPPPRNAQFNLNIQNPNGTPYTSPGYVTSIVVRIYRPTSEPSTDPEKPGTYYLQLGKRDTDETYASTTTSVNGLWAYPHTYQMLMVMAKASDGTIAAIGGTVISALASGTGNPTVNISLMPPAPIMITFSSQINSLRIDMNIGGWRNDIASATTYTYFNVAYVYVPNRLDNIKEWEHPELQDPPVPYNTLARDIQITLNGSTKTITLTTSDDYFRWKQTIIDFPTWISGTTTGWTLAQ